ncbi:MAG: choice-of-anchor D domain-containing protein [Flavobacterium sp.]|uniref:LamG-like jellyroll fold domain-containing protein n=1 Tax=Flavobacterium sp. TaxID=239 RepID=UPI0026187A8B|nr:LamG-like jellyroll fold domain-containing protein [Flavobacterium sp.]MDD5150016.1 choice-of-anchor D domain-containing protein [Flavobacterium sp.]
MEKTTLLTKKVYLFLVFIFIPFLGLAQTTATFSVTGTWICPAGVTSVTVEAWGGGGAGGGATGYPAAGGGGAGGAYVKNNSLSVTPGASYTITVAQTKLGTTGTGLNGDSTFFALTATPAVLLINAVGGNGGNAATSNSFSANGGTAVTTGNIGGTASDIYGSAGLKGTGSGGSKSGSGGDSGGGAAGGAGTTSTTPNAGSLYGGGGSGGRATGTTDKKGGNGAAGKLILTWILPQEINIQGFSNSIVSGDTTPSIIDGTDFGSTQIVTSPISRTFTIENLGGPTLTIGAISISGINASDFTLTTAPSSSIVGGSSSTFVVTFNPNISGTKTASISIVNNDSDENPYTFDLTGIGIQTFFDSDGDGVFDNVDIDDDNDGILDITEETNCNNSNGHKVNYKFLNETFGTGTRTTINTTYDAYTSYCFQDATTPSICEGSPNSTDLNDGKYTVGPSAQIASWAAQYWYMGSDHTGNTDGRMAIFNASNTPGIFYTASITGALPNLPITYSFWVLNLDRTDAPGVATRLRPNIKVEFRDGNDVVLATINTGAIAPTTNGNLAGDWYQFTANLTLNVDAFKVIFINNETGGLGNDLALDDILITQTLCDYDGDGIADVFDLDADNDGIPDVVETGLGSISSGKGKIDVPWVDANGNGLHDAAEATAALPALDSDGDGQPNYLDLDSDNDSLFDVDESGAGNSNAVTGFINGDGDINGDGVGDGPESETFRSKDTNGDTILEGYGDGILDIYDYGTGADQYGNLNQGISNANPDTTYLKDTDGDGIPDYLDVKSDGVNFDIANTLKIYDYKTLDTNNDGIIDGTTDIDHDGILDTFDTNTSQFGSPRDLHTKLFLDFDGRNDYGQSTAILGGLANASLMAWIDLNPAFSTDGVIVGQDKFQIRITSDKKLEAVVNGTTLTYNTALNVSQWYNVGATYDGANINLYLNGVLVGTQAKTGAIASDTSLLTLGKDPSTSTKYFKGKIDEVRVFNVALTDSQLQRMVYQEIKDFGSEIRGEIVPKNVATSPASLPFANLLRYYRMDTYKDDIIDDLTTPAVDLTGTKIYNHKYIYVQQAPMPFITERTGDFATAVNSPTNEVRGLDIMDNDYSIVNVKHDITETSNAIDLGMFVDPGVNIIMNNDTKIQNDWYLKLDGKIDLEGKSQLVQTIESDLEVTSAGSIERDQQGQSNIYNYNYWSSPVSPVNTISNNTDYSIDGVMKDGTNPASPANINWVGGYDGAPTSPISLAGYWIYKFDNYANDYYNWIQLGQTGAVRVGLGYTLKGSGAATATQNYVFTGKPNNGLITSNTVGIDQLLLIGNPYASALNATAFIIDNSGSIDGTLYFWQHYDTNNTHILKDYQGGYAARNLIGGLPPVTPILISGLGSSSRIPGQFIPVGQGFFVNGNLTTGGTVTFKNGQRGFHKEDQVGVSNSMFKTAQNNKTKNIGSNINDPVPADNFMKIRLGFNSNNNYHRQVLLGFMNENATNGMDYGYDALNLDEFPNDMYFLVEGNQLVIQGVGFFDTNASYPIGVKTDVEGKVSFIVDAIENFNSEQPIFIYDNVTDTYNDIRNGLFEVVLPVGVTDNRFSLCFTDKTLGVNNAVANTINDIKVAHFQKGNILVINNTLSDVTVEKVILFNMLGQSIATWKTANQEQQNIQIPIKGVSSGIYIAKLKTSKGDLSKKIVLDN